LTHIVVDDNILDRLPKVPQPALLPD